jgi:hypothetical protein
MTRGHICEWYLMYSLTSFGAHRRDLYVRPEDGSLQERLNRPRRWYIMRLTPNRCSNPIADSSHQSTRHHVSHNEHTRIRTYIR